MKNKYIRLILETFAAALFCGIFSLVFGLLMNWYYTRQLPEGNVISMLATQYLLYSLLFGTLGIFVPLLLFNFIKMKYLMRKSSHVRS